MKKALIVRLSSLGDVVLSSVLIDPLLRAGYRPYLLTLKPYDELFVDDPRISVIATTKEKLFSSNTLSRLKQERFDLIVDIHKNPRTLLLRFLLRGRWLTYRKDSVRRRLAVRFKSFRRPFFITSAYLKALGDISRGASPLPKVVISPERLKKLKDSLPIDKFVVLAPGARYRKKMYPHYNELSCLIEEKGLSVVWLGDSSDAKLVRDGLGLNLCGKLGLADVLGILKLAIAFVGNDSGLLHCARAVGTPAIQIYGGTHPTLGFSLFPEEGKVILKGMDCQPCDIHGKGKCKLGDYRCLDIKPSLIVSELVSLLRIKGLVVD